MSSPLETKSTRPTEPRTSGRVLGFSLAFLFALGAFLSGLQLGQGVSSGDQSANIFSSLFIPQQSVENSDQPDLTEFWRVWNLLEDKFITSSSTKVLSDQERVQGAIDGLVDAYDDPYTVYFPPADAAAFNENIAGNFSGVGMEVGLRDDLITVISPLPDTPAEQAGILAGDVIVKIDDLSTEDMRIDEAVSHIRGEKGTVVNLEIYREGESDFLNIPVTRDTINIPTVKTEQIGNTFIIALYSFNAVAEEQMRDALQEYLNSSAETLMLDLRGNPGGYLQGAVNIASYFLPAGKVVVKEEFGDSSKNDQFRSRGRQIQQFTPQDLVVLVDNGSASASEILAGALKDHGVATIVGTQTFGKGSVQELVKLDDGSSLKVTIARWFTPNGISISEGGLTPDVVINRTADQRLAGEDPQKDAALRLLRGETVESELAAEEMTVEELDSEAAGE